MIHVTIAIYFFHFTELHIRSESKWVFSIFLTVFVFVEKLYALHFCAWRSLGRCFFNEYNWCKSCSKNVREIDSRRITCAQRSTIFLQTIPKFLKLIFVKNSIYLGQFHQHFMRGFFVRKFCGKLFCACREG